MTIGSSVWAQLTTSQAVQYGVLFIDPNTLQPSVDSGPSNALMQFGYDPIGSFINGPALYLNTQGVMTGSDTLNLGGSAVSDSPINSQNASLINGINGFRVGSFNGTRQLPAVSINNDTLGEYSAYAMNSYASVLTPTKVARMIAKATQGVGTDCGGVLIWSTKTADAATFTDWVQLTSVGEFTPVANSTPLTPLINTAPKLGAAGKGFGKLVLDYNITATVGAVTIHKPAGRAIIALGAASVVITNNLVTANSIIVAVLAGIDATLTSIKAIVAGAGTFTITGNAVATANTPVNFLVINTDS